MSEGPLPLSAAAGLVISRSITVPGNSTVPDSSTVPDNSAVPDNNAVPDDITAKDGFIPFSEAPTTNEQPEKQSGSTTNTTVVILTAIVGIFVGVLGALGIYLWRRRKIRGGTLELPKNVEGGGTALSQSEGVPNGESVSMFLHQQTEVKPKPLCQQGFLHSGGPRVATLPGTRV